MIAKERGPASAGTGAVAVPLPFKTFFKRGVAGRSGRFAALMPEQPMAEAKTSSPGSVARPLSPHLQIYRPMLTMMMSIVHRITGGALFVGTAIVAWWLIAAASGPNAYATFEWVMGSIIGKLVLFGYTWALIHHMLGGIRHLIWDMGAGFGPQEREWLAAATLVGSVGLTLILWVVGYMMLGGVR